MNDQAPEEKWIQKIGALKALYPFLQDDDFQYDYGKKEVMLMALQEKLGKNRIEFNQLLESIDHTTN